MEILAKPGKKFRVKRIPPANYQEMPAETQSLILQLDLVLEFTQKHIH